MLEDLSPNNVNVCKHTEWQQLRPHCMSTTMVSLSKNDTSKAAFMDRQTSGAWRKLRIEEMPVSDFADVEGAAV